MSADQGGFMSEQISAFPGRCVCPWVGHDPLYLSYHDHEWGIPVHDDHRLFELLSLEAMQAGLSWITILRRRDSFRAAFDAFNPELVAQYDESKIKTLLANPGIIRNRRKIEAIIHNAAVFLSVRTEFGSFDHFLWSFTSDIPIIGSWPTASDIPVSTPLAEALSVYLRTRGFAFVGPTICYAFLQAAGVVNDHIASCDRAIIG
jgi:DNA-3-methyladenine glycosylase I